MTGREMVTLPRHDGCDVMCVRVRVYALRVCEGLVVSKWFAGLEDAV